MPDTNYTVLKERTLADLIKEVQSEDSPLSSTTKVFVPLGSTEASNGQQAIIKVTAGKSAEEKNGDFAAPSTRNFPVYPRHVKMVEDDAFGQPRSVKGQRPAGDSS